MSCPYPLLTRREGAEISLSAPSGAKPEGAFFWALPVRLQEVANHHPPMQTLTIQRPRPFPRREPNPPPARPRAQRPLQPYFLELGDELPFGHDFLLQNPRPDLTEADPEAWTGDRRKSALDRLP